MTCTCFALDVAIDKAVGWSSSNCGDACGGNEDADAAAAEAVEHDSISDATWLNEATV